MILKNKTKDQKNEILIRDFICINVLVTIAICATMAALLLQRWGFLPQLPCAMLSTLHVYCPGCGGTRAMFAFLQGHFMKSLYYNPAVLLGAVLVLYYEITVIVTIVKNNGKTYYYNKATFLYLYLAIVVGFAVFRDVLLLVAQIDLLGDVL